MGNVPIQNLAQFPIFLIFTLRPKANNNYDIYRGKYRTHSTLLLSSHSKFHGMRFFLCLWVLGKPPRLMTNTPRNISPRKSLFKPWRRTHVVNATQMELDYAMETVVNVKRDSRVTTAGHAKSTILVKTVNHSKCVVKESTTQKPYSKQNRNQTE